MVSTDGGFEMPFDNPWYIITLIGDPRVWAAIAIILFVIRITFKHQGKKKFLWVSTFIIFVGFGMAGAFGLAELLKNIFQIPRACVSALIENPHCLENFAFPSGHATIAFAAFTGIFLMVRKKKHLWIFIFPVLVSMSRIALGVHSLVDVTGGLVTGVAFILVYTEILKSIHFFDRWLSGTPRRVSTHPAIKSGNRRNK